MSTSIKILTLAVATAFSPLLHAGGWGHCHSGGYGGFSVGVYGAPFYFGGFGSPYYGYAPYSTPYTPYYYPAQTYRNYYGGNGYSSGLGVTVQRELARRGYYHGAVDGLIGPMSRDAIRRYQANRGLPITGVIDSRLVRSLGLN